MVNCIIVHGCTEDKTDNPAEHWIPWLKEQLEIERIKVSVPLMPTPWEPKYREWKEVFDGLIVDKNSILIGHSCGGAFLVRWLGDAGKKIKNFINNVPLMKIRNFRTVLIKPRKRIFFAHR